MKDVAHETYLSNCVMLQTMRKYAEDHAPLRRNSSSEDVGSIAAFLSSELAASVTGQTIYGEISYVNASCVLQLAGLVLT